MAAFTFSNVSAGTTDSLIVSAITGKIIVVLAAACECGDTETTTTFNTKGSGSGVAISMNFQNGINGGFVLPYQQFGWFRTNSGESLTATTGAGSTTGIHVVYEYA